MRPHRTRTVLAATIAALTVPAAVTAEDGYQPSGFVQRGAVEGGDALYLPEGDILNVRNIQGGVIGNQNLDIGAGSTRHPGDIVMQYDVGTGRVVFYDGKKRKVAEIGPTRAVFYVPVIVKRGIRKAARPRRGVSR